MVLCRTDIVLISFLLSLSLMKNQEYNSQATIAFEDYEKATDSVFIRGFYEKTYRKFSSILNSHSPQHYFVIMK